MNLSNQPQNIANRGEFPSDALLAVIAGTATTPVATRFQEFCRSVSDAIPSYPVGSENEKVQWNEPSNFLTWVNPDKNEDAYSHWVSFEKNGLMDTPFSQIEEWKDRSPGAHSILCVSEIFWQLSPRQFQTLLIAIQNALEIQQSDLQLAWNRFVATPQSDRLRADIDFSRKYLLPVYTILRRLGFAGELC